MKTVQETKSFNIRTRISFNKKLGKLAVQKRKQMNQVKEQREKEEEMNLKNIGYQCNKMVKRVFWKNLLKIRRHICLEI